MRSSFIAATPAAIVWRCTCSGELRLTRDINPKGEALKHRFICLACGIEAVAAPHASGGVMPGGQMVAENLRTRGFNAGAGWGTMNDDVLDAMKSYDYNKKRK